jgi:hypothetical protein
MLLYWPGRKMEAVGAVVDDKVAAAVVRVGDDGCDASAIVRSRKASVNDAFRGKQLLVMTSQNLPYPCSWALVHLVARPAVVARTPVRNDTRVRSMG